MEVENYFKHLEKKKKNYFNLYKTNIISLNNSSLNFNEKFIIIQTIILINQMLKKKKKKRVIAVSSNP